MLVLQKCAGNTSNRTSNSTSNSKYTHYTLTRTKDHPKHAYHACRIRHARRTTTCALGGQVCAGHLSVETIARSVCCGTCGTSCLCFCPVRGTSTRVGKGCFGLGVATRSQCVGLGGGNHASTAAFFPRSFGLHTTKCGIFIGRTRFTLASSCKTPVEGVIKKKQRGQMEFDQSIDIVASVPALKTPLVSHYSLLGF